MSIHAEPPPPIVSEPHGISYATSSQLGKGGFAICFKAERLDKDRPTGQLVALKIVKTMMEPAKLAQKFVTELQIHSKLSHPNIVNFHRAFSFGESTYVVLELCSSGSLADLLKKRKNLTMPEIRRFIIQVSGAVKYLHARNIVHRDLKTGNLFLDEQMNIKVGDFGLAALLVSGKDMDAKRRTTMCGTPNYLAPEILEKGKGHNEKVDLWAIGIIAYTLAVGRAPFHAGSKDEIYKKLRVGDYSWPELSSITNDISADLRHLVSSLLVTEELRPCPDQLVAHPFFKIAFVPTRMSRSQRSKAPTWPETPIPSPEVLERGYSDSWWRVCSETGVGEYTPGKCFQLNSGKRIRSVVRDIEREVAAGRQPVLPIPHDTVYTTFPYSGTWSTAPAPALGEIVEETEVTTGGRQLKEIASNEVQATAPSVLPKIQRETSVEFETRKRKEIELMPPPPAARRQGTVRKTRVPPGEATRDARTKEVEYSRPFSQHNSSQGASSDGAKCPSPELAAEGPGVAPPITRSIDASLARRRTVRRNPPSQDLVPAEAQPDYSEKPAGKPTLPARTMRSRARAPPLEAIEILDEEKIKLEPAPALLRSMPTKTDLPVSKQSEVTSSSAFSGTDPEEVLQRLRVFRDNLASAMIRKRTAPPRRALQQATEALPFVCRWVDYSRKHGVGYVLEDGTLGCIVNASPTKGTPVTYVTVRRGEYWLSRVGKRFKNLEKVPFQIFEDRGDAGIHKIRPATPNGGERERLRTLKVLWVKFGRYMSSSVYDSEEEVAGENEEDTRNEEDESSNLLLVRFYQRIGNVGVWGFSDGCLQIHFPDHTKLVLSADGLHTSATLVPVEGVNAIELTNELPSRLLKGRETMMHSIHALLYGSQSGRGQKSFAEIIKANMVEQKLAFVLDVLDQWIKGGGLGRTATDERLQWQGLWVNDHVRKIDWNTVGRLGGDDVEA